MKALFLFIGVVIILNLLFAYYHEQSHEMIAMYHGCISFERTLNSFQCHAYIPRENDVALQEEFLHSQNEIFGYHMLMIMNAILFSFYMLSIVLYEIFSVPKKYFIKDKKEDFYGLRHK